MNFTENIDIYRFRQLAPPPPINFVHGSHKYHIDIISHVAAAPGPLACPSRGAQSP